MFKADRKCIKLKTKLHLAWNRVKLLQAKKAQEIYHQHKEIEDDLVKNKFVQAKLKIYEVLGKEAYIEALGIIEFYCSKLLASVGILESYKKELDPSLEKAVSTLIWVTPHMKFEVPELKSISKQLKIKYGKSYTKTSIKNKISMVCPELRKRIEFGEKSDNLTLETLEEIMSKYNITKDQKNKFESYLNDIAAEAWSAQITQKDTVPTKERKTKNLNVSRIQHFLGYKIPSIFLFKRVENTDDPTNGHNSNFDKESETINSQNEPECEPEMNNLQNTDKPNISVVPEHIRRYHSPSESFQDSVNMNLPNSFCPGKCSFSENNNLNDETKVVLNANINRMVNNTMSANGRSEQNMSPTTKLNVEYSNGTIGFPAVPDEPPPKYDEICSGSSNGSFYSLHLPSPAPTAPNSPRDNLYFDSKNCFYEDTN